MQYFVAVFYTCCDVEAMGEHMICDEGESRVVVFSQILPPKRQYKVDVTKMSVKHVGVQAAWLAMVRGLRRGGV